MVKIFIDPGHGGSDPGAVGNGIQEKNITWDISNRIREILVSEYQNVSVRMSRTGDQTVSLSARTNAANSWGADYYLSVHINSGGGTGFESFTYRGTGRPTLTYQEHIHKNIMQKIDLRDRGLKQAGFHVLRESHMPAILTENGFIDNANDAALLKDSNFIEALARGHANGVAEAFRLSKVSPGSSAPAEPEGGLFKVQIGAYQERDNADNQANQAKSKGFNTYIIDENGLYKVQIGAFSIRENAEQLLKEAEQAGFEAVIVIN